MEGPKFEYYAMCYNTNSGKVEMFNIFRNAHVYEWTLRDIKRHLRNKKKYPYEQLKEDVRRSIMNQMWSRYQYEYSAGEPFPKDLDKMEKKDIYFQAEPNLDLIIQGAISAYKKYQKENKSNG